MVAPDLVDVETVSVLRKRWLNRTLSDQRFEDALYALEALEIDRYPTLPLMRRAFELRANLSAYDAAYVALAEVVEGEELTADGRLASAPEPRCEIRVLSDDYCSAQDKSPTELVTTMAVLQRAARGHGAHWGEGCTRIEIAVEA